MFFISYSGSLFENEKKGKSGIKAIILYPMNALAADQETRVAKLIWNNSDLVSKKLKYSRWHEIYRFFLYLLSYRADYTHKKMPDHSS